MEPPQNPPPFGMYTMKKIATGGISISRRRQ
uniref:Uncharacterized protein n=1 Tax=Setaria italica TaxID=4555 RepID=K4ANA6_SETIT